MTLPTGAEPGYRRTPLSAEEKVRGEANFAPVVALVLVASGRFRVSADTQDQVELFQGVARRVSDMLRRPVVSYANGRDIVITFGQEEAPALALCAARRYAAKKARIRPPSTGCACTGQIAPGRHMAPARIAAWSFLPSAWLVRGSKCRPSDLVKLNLGEQVATIRATRSWPDGIHIYIIRGCRGRVCLKGAGRIVGWIRPHVPEASDGILTSAGICEGFAGAGVSTGVLVFAGFAGLVAGTLAMGAVEYSKLRAERDQQVAQLTAERVRLETAPDAELDELTELYVSRGLSPGLARQVAIELTAHDALAAHAEAEYGITSTSMASPLRDALAVSVAFASGALLPWLAMVLIPGSSRAAVTFVIVLAALALTGWVSARISEVHPLAPMVRTASIGGLSMLITYFAGHLLYP